MCIKAPDGIVVTLQLVAGEMLRFDKVSLVDEEGNSMVLETGLYTTSRIAAAALQLLLL